MQGERVHFNWLRWNNRRLMTRCRRRSLITKYFSWMQNKEIERLRGTLNVMKHMCNGGDTEVRQKMEKVLKDLRGKEGEIEDVEGLNQERLKM
ncbi:hypothetical protein CUMW_286260 [Citrus unshiu]|uniref:Uncharacterized protein n=1 Tax=Citrus unshiu TaxID=55188 RepID=A0A2H5MVR6_CITUN|nr:hypothetical protein CUMW_286260 [Citrus unshiu]